MNIQNRDRSRERGSAGTKFMLVLMVIVVAANAGYNYIPVAYAGENFKQEMQTAVVAGMALPPRVSPVDTVRYRIQQAAQNNDIPKDMFLDVKMGNQTVQAHASYQQKVNLIPFGIYVYTYNFDYTAIPTGYILKDNK